MLKRAFALSDQGAKDLAKGIIATACANLIQIIPSKFVVDGSNDAFRKSGGDSS